MSGIFISYRRSTSQHLARSIFMALKQHGHDVFLDVNSIDSGAFDAIIRNQIAARPHFLLLLSTGALERCQNEGDWLRLEIEEAFRLNRNIVPVFDEGFDIHREKHFLPEPIRSELPLKNAPPYSHYYFDAFIQALSDRFFKQVVDNVAVAPTPPAERAEVQKRIQQAAGELPNDGWTPQIPASGTPQPVSPEKQAELNDFVRKAAAFQKSLEPNLPKMPLIWGVENILPTPFEWVYIPPGEVTVEINKQIETVSVNAFNIAKYPITNEQFKAFAMTEDGYRNPLWWDDTIDSREWWAKHKNAEPLSIHSLALDGDHPAKNVSWYEAIAFCKWLAHRFNAPAPNLPPAAITLPTEAQWLRAAQGSETRTYPWGSEFDSQRCNTKVSRIGRTTPVSQYSNGASLYGVMDLSGNVFEWCLERHTAEDVRGVRGGSWKTDQVRAQLYYREEIPVSNRLDNIGFRIVMMNNG
ncbi:MAG: SUMF1/EgtB/PvdO family nonheme iron enzyme [Chloroflexi bacterium]|nr:SUMF1/EgtB/PvdO family nonheme iron enzyme [Chloroflexota bacterium]MCC6892809.1 SUMF1/EgtB/PvdO family nonheme iron enzyme [Anaerolineae bacterium]